MEKVKNIALGFATFLCITILIGLIISFTMKKSTEKYLDEKKINEFISNLNILDMVLDETGKEYEEFNDIKNKLTDSGIPVESIDGFFRTKPVDNYAKKITSKSISNTLNNKKEQLIEEGEIYDFLEDNISTISEEMKENKIPESDKLTKERQDQFLNKIKDKVPDIEGKLNELSDKIREELDAGKYVEKIQKGIVITRFLYNNVLDLILITSIAIFAIGIIITRQSIINGVKWVGISFIISSILINIIIIVIDIMSTKINKISEGMRLYLNKLFIHLKNTLEGYSIGFIIIGAILIVISLIIYLISEKIENKQIKKYL